MRGMTNATLSSAIIFSNMATKKRSTKAKKTKKVKKGKKSRK